MLYVANAGRNTITVYDARSGRLLRRISAGINVPVAIILDNQQALYVANFGSSSISVYARGANRPVLTIRRGINNPVAMALGRDGALYVANEGATRRGGRYGWVSVYPRGSAVPERETSRSIAYPVSLAIDEARNLYVANCYVSCSSGAITMYSASFSQFRRVTKHIFMPMGISLAPSGDLFVANYQGGGKQGSVAVFERGSMRWIRTIVSGVDGPRTTAFDDDGHCFVASFGANDYSYPADPGNVTEYTLTGTRPIRTIRAGIRRAYAISVDSNHTLYVANYGDATFAGSVTTYKPGGLTPVLVLREGIGNPTAVAIWPPLTRSK